MLLRGFPHRTRQLQLLVRPGNTEQIKNLLPVFTGKTGQDTVKTFSENSEKIISCEEGILEQGNR